VLRLFVLLKMLATSLEFVIQTLEFVLIQRRLMVLLVTTTMLVLKQIRALLEFAVEAIQ
jgi:hypothetical protein